MKTTRSWRMRFLTTSPPVFRNAQGYEETRLTVPLGPVPRCAAMSLPANTARARMRSLPALGRRCPQYRSKQNERPLTQAAAPIRLAFQPLSAHLTLTEQVPRRCWTETRRRADLHWSQTSGWRRWRSAGGRYISQTARFALQILKQVRIQFPKNTSNLLLLQGFPVSAEASAAHLAHAPTPLNHTSRISIWNPGRRRAGSRRVEFVAVIRRVVYPLA